MKRFLDIILSLGALTCFALPMLVIAAVIRVTSSGTALYWSERVGLNNKHFRMPKFRTMRSDTPEMGKHLLPGTQDWTTPVGRFLRKTSLDELPQLLSILRGDMSLVGPRPVLPNEKVLIAMRTLRGVHRVKPGLTGWAQINGRAELKVQEKLEFDVVYAKSQSLGFDLKILALTAARVLGRKGIDQDATAVERTETR